MLSKIYKRKTALEVRQYVPQQVEIVYGKYFKFSQIL